MTHCGKTQPPPMESPCTRQCGLVKGSLCRGCYRTRSEIMQWSHLTVTDRMQLMHELKGQISTHDCPVCTGPAYCAIDAGKSATTCWCMDKPKTRNPDIADGNKCLCRRCLTRELENETIED